MKAALMGVISFAAWMSIICVAALPNLAHAGARKEPVIVVLGDSLTAGYGLAPGQAFPAQLQAALAARGQRVRIVNAGVSGDTAAGGLTRFDWSVPPSADGLILELGANDALRGIDPADTKASLEGILNKASARGLPVLLAGMEAPRNLGPDYVAKFHAMYADLAKRYDVIFYPFFLKGVALNEALTLPDRMHPNEKGVAIMVRNILPKVEALVKRIEAKSSGSVSKS